MKEIFERIRSVSPRKIARTAVLGSGITIAGFSAEAFVDTIFFDTKPQGISNEQVSQANEVIQQNRKELYISGDAVQTSPPFIPDSRALDEAFRVVSNANEYYINRVGHTLVSLTGTIIGFGVIAAGSEIKTHPIPVRETKSQESA